MSTTRTVMLVSSDGDRFEVGEVFAKECRFVNGLIEEVDFNGPLQLSITTNILSMVIEFCYKHAELPHEDLNAFDSEFVEVDHTILIDLIHAAYTLHIKSLLELTSKTVVDMITEKTAQEIHKIFNMDNDFTPQDMERFRKLRPSAFK